jgi:hypothetical protein
MHGLTVAIVEGESDSMFVLVSFGSGQENRIRQSRVGVIRIFHSRTFGTCMWRMSIYFGWCSRTFRSQIDQLRRDRSGRLPQESS